MTWDLKSNQPIYTQLLEMIKIRIISGYYQAGGKLPSVRELAAEASVNPNTMQKALSELERSGLIHTQRTSGRFITEDETMITDLRNKVAEEKIRYFFHQMEELGFTPEEIKKMMNQSSKEMTK